ncbi:MAG: class I SAM-dependent methyltransferase [bacterium]
MKSATVQQQERNEHWWKSWFNDLYLDVYSHRDDEQAADEVKSTIALLPLEPEHVILDMGCGNGRHCRGFNQQGFCNVIGVDYSFPLLKNALSYQQSSLFVRADMRFLPFPDQFFDVSVSYFTSFGYFKTNVENLQVLHEMSRVLKTGGWFLMDYLNPTYIRKNFVPSSRREVDSFIIEEKRHFTDSGDRIEKEIIIHNWGDHEHHYHESVRLYAYDDMVDLLQSADLAVSGVLGSFSGQPFDDSAPRMVLYGQKI